MTFELHSIIQRIASSASDESEDPEDHTDKESSTPADDLLSSELGDTSEVDSTGNKDDDNEGDGNDVEDDADIEDAPVRHLSDVHTDPEDNVPTPPTIQSGRMWVLSFCTSLLTFCYRKSIHSSASQGT